jgi:hypothetical protein
VSEINPKRTSTFFPKEEWERLEKTMLQHEARDIKNLVRVGFCNGLMIAQNFYEKVILRDNPLLPEERSKAYELWSEEVAYMARTMDEILHDTMMKLSERGKKI